MDGCTWVVGNDIWFSPNATYFPGVPPSQHQPANSSSTRSLVDHQAPPQFVPLESKASDFQAPHWWRCNMEWMAFVPRQRVVYQGIWFETLACIPDRLPDVSPVRGHPLYQLPPRLRVTWDEAEKLLVKASQHLSKENKLSYVKPFQPSAWGYSDTFSSHQEALRHIEEGRDWFAMWLGILYWLVRRTPEGEGYIEGLKPKTWVIMLIRYTLKQREVDLLRLNPLLQRGWKVDRVGVFLHNPLHADGQPAAEWFIHQGIPVWYRWGEAERLMPFSVSYRLVAPSTECMREAQSQFEENQLSATTAPSASSPQFYSTFSDNPVSYSYDLDFQHSTTPNSHTSSLITHTPIKSASIEDPPAPMDPDTATVEKRASEDAEKRQWARETWEAWKTKLIRHRERHLKSETEEQKQRRLNWERRPPTSSAMVFEWDWSYDLTAFVPRLVRADDRVEIIKEHKKYGEAIYDSIENQWHCCPSLEAPKDLYEDSEGSDTDMEDSGGTSETVQSGAVSSENMKRSLQILQQDTRERGESSDNIMEILTLQFGPQRTKSLVRAIGLCPIEPDNPFFKSELAHACTDFLECFLKWESGPNSDSWDISLDNRLTLHFSRRLSSIQRVTSDRCTLYMFDFAALFISRLNDQLDEEQLALELVRSGVPFRTLQEECLLTPTSTLQELPSQPSLRIDDHTFDTNDYKFFLKRCESVFATTRGRAALLRGGIVWRLAVDYIPASLAVSGPSGLYSNPQYMFKAMDSSGIVYVDDELTTEEYDVICGLYRYLPTKKAKHETHLSWFPSLSLFENCRLNIRRWSQQCEELYQHRVAALQGKDVSSDKWRAPFSSTEWKKHIRGYTESRNAYQELEKQSAAFIVTEVGGLIIEQSAYNTENTFSQNYGLGSEQQEHVRTSGSEQQAYVHGGDSSSRWELDADCEGEGHGDEPLLKHRCFEASSGISETPVRFRRSPLFMITIKLVPSVFISDSLSLITNALFFIIHSLTFFTLGSVPLASVAAFQNLKSKFASLPQVPQYTSPIGINSVASRPAIAMPYINVVKAQVHQPSDLANGAISIQQTDSTQSMNSATATASPAQPKLQLHSYFLLTFPSVSGGLTLCFDFFLFYYGNRNCKTFSGGYFVNGWPGVAADSGRSLIVIGYCLLG
ncbi:hypothetical protein NP233_g12613 [Leucocoprinus birnbaumii]|uniref:Uncharacterized protein n=1 Tax=Leucocoprinus birnbaumii TaxID=56174 RepID=A0AAD5YPU6_9AGAR|nr:hypothetical protein NP233_g12613 [Leucocoprinus birnbaumii]